MREEEPEQGIEIDMAQPIKAFLTAESLDFAILHITSFYDTDFFPRTEEFRAIAHSWPVIRTHILEATLDQILSAAPLVLAWPKVKGGFRVVHRLEPLDALIYTAMARTISEKVEASRAPIHVACSYRLSSYHPNSFFTAGSGYDVYRQRCESLAALHPFVLCADITDFYNKIYLHRLQNSIQLATNEPPGIASRIEYFLSTLNTKASQGIPVGPAASIVMSEVSLNDVDQFLYNKGFSHVRYVDDYRIFGTYEQLLVLLQSLTLYLHENHRLTLNAQKTFIVESAVFLETEINNHYQEEKLEMFGDIEGVNPYASPGEADDDDDDDAYGSDNAGAVLLAAVDKVLAYPSLDLGLIRAIVRSAKSHKVDDLVSILLQNLEFFAPAVNDVMLYIDAVTPAEIDEERIAALAALCTSIPVKLVAVRMWLQWYFSRHAKLLENPNIRTFVLNASPLRHQAQAAITMKSPAWVKEHKATMLGQGSWDRRSIILAAATLSKDERDKWLAPLIKAGSLSKLDSWLAKWVIDGSPVTPPDVLPPDLSWIDSIFSLDLPNAPT